MNLILDSRSMLCLQQDRKEAQKAKCMYGCPGVPDMVMCACWKQLDDFCVAKVTQTTNILTSTEQYL